MAFPWQLLLMLGIPFLSKLLFPGEAGTTGTAATEQETVTETDYPRYRSPSLGLLDPTLLKGLLGNWQLFQGAGMPGGRGDVGIGGMTQDIFKLLEEQWPKITEGYRTAEMPGKEPVTRETRRQITPGSLRR